ncbi:LysR family transcriptional regulator [Enterovibrio paralichthyis]|uniref:LysR family transcriptional regulator n=1 Tax=Enterovibrio paralichthyis TaxID=2853805 RepID=UPI001C4716A1|nr:LysR family transcriptional regulator [Enterovibrio paralichthyis]MBV7296592.1 LysR family transcriptional regulator [Enterovibrio paralichthyis]
MLSFEALQVLDAIDRKGSFAAAADALNRAPSSLSYQVQKLEQELDLVIFDRSGHKAVFTDAGKLLLERGRALINAADELIADAKSLAHGWELDITLAYDGLLPARYFFPLVDRLAEKSSTRFRLQEEILAGAWEALLEDRADILISPEPPSAPQGVKIQELGYTDGYWVAAVDHPIHKHKNPFDQDVRRLYRSVSVADTARNAKTCTFNILDEQPRLTVSSMAEKYHAILDGYGIGTMPVWWVEKDIEEGRLKVIEGSDTYKLLWVIAWKRNRMGNAKSWLIREIPKVLKVIQPEPTPKVG